jgi:hypothetical protein
MKSVAAVLRELIPFPFSDADVCELILWADKHGQSKKAIVQCLSLCQMPRTLTEEWCHGRKMRIEFEREALHMLNSQHGSFQKLLVLTTEFWQRHAMALAKPPQVHRYASLEEASAAAAAARERAAKRVAGKGKGKGIANSKAAYPHNSDSDSDSDLEKMRSAVKTHALDEVCTGGCGSFNLKVMLHTILNEASKQESFSLCMSYKDGKGSLTTGRNLRAAVEAKTGMDARKMRLIVKGARKMNEATIPVSNSAALAAWGFEAPGKMRLIVKGADLESGSPISNSAVLAAWDFEAPGVVVEVHTKQRGGKKPGNGWHAQRSHGRTYQMCIAGAIVRETVFSRVDQYLTVLEDSTSLDTMVALCKVLKQDAVVVCGGGPKGLQVLQHEATSHGLHVEVSMTDGTGCIRFGLQKLWLLCELDAPACEPVTIYYDECEQDHVQELPEPMPESGEPRRDRHTSSRSEGNIGKGTGKGQGGKGGKAAAPEKDEFPVAATIAVPPDVSDAGFIIVAGGHFLRETASLSRVICAVSGTGRSKKSVPMFHLVTSTRQVVLESEEDLRAISSVLDATGRVKTAVEFQSQPCVPPGAVLITGDMQETESAFPDITQLPALLNFRLRMASLGLVTRLRDRYGCTISEIFDGVLKEVLVQRTSRTSSD